MPLFRQYQQAFSLNPTDAFVIDRIGIGTMFVEANVLPSGANGVMLSADLPPGNTDNWTPEGYDSTIDAIDIGTGESGATLQGLTGGVRDRRLILVNRTAGELTIANLASSSDTNGFYCPGFTDLIVSSPGGVTIIYDDTDGQTGWYVVMPFGNSGSSTLAFKYVGE